MVMCFVPDCDHYSERNTCKFLRFPTEEGLKKKWIKSIRRADRTPSRSSLICSCHFVGENRKNGPTIFKRNASKYMTFESPEKRKVKRKLLTEPEDCDEEQQPCEEQHEEHAVHYNTENVASTSLNNSVVAEAENYFLRQEVEKLREEVQHLKQCFSFKEISGDEKLVIMYTGLPNKDIFQVLLTLCSRFEMTYFYGWNVQSLSKEDQLFMTLMKLRQNLTHADLSVRFRCSVATVTNVVLTWIYFLHEILVEGFMSTVPSLSKNKTCMPSCFSPFTHCRVVIDCTEVYTAVPNSMSKQQMTYSHYKNRNTLKGLVGVAPNGVVTFTSKLYGGSTSDKEITQHCGLLEQLKEGDLILADKGFLISDILPPGVHVNIPPFLSTPQFTNEQVMQTRSIARARIHVERAICRIKGFTILDFIPKSLLPHASKVWQVCAALTNFQYPLIREMDIFYRPKDVD